MKKSLKSIVRAISPFARNKEEGTLEFAKFFWILDCVDLRGALKDFYKIYNPEKAFIVGEIVAKYEGDEILLLQQLCERYNLSEADMQEYLDANTNITKSNKSRQIISSSSSVSSYQTGDSGSKGMSSGLYRSFAWDLDNVDVSSVLKLVYKKYNPQKIPNLDSLYKKTEEEIQQILRQLCKRHSLSQEDMYVFIEKCRGIQDYNTQQLSSTLSYQHHASIKSPPPPPPPPPRDMLSREAFDKDFQMDKSKYITAGDEKPSASNLRPILADGKRFTMGNVLSEMLAHQQISGNGYNSILTADKVEENSGQPIESLHDTVSSKYKERDYNNSYLIHGQETEDTENHQIVRSLLSSEMTKIKGTLEQPLNELLIISQSTRKSVEHLLETSSNVYDLITSHSKIIEQKRQSDVALNSDIKELQLVLRSEKDLSKRLIDQADSFTKTINAQKEVIFEHEKKLSFLESKAKSLDSTIYCLQADREDLLQLVNILAAAPIPAKNIIESYLLKASKSIPDDIVHELLKQTNSFSDRINILLKWKRSNGNLSKESKISNERISYELKLDDRQNQQKSSIPLEEGEYGIIENNLTDDSLSMDIDEDARLNAQTQKGLNSEFEGWKECFDSKLNRKYYFDASTKSSVWTNPSEYGDKVSIKDKSRTASRSGSPAVSSKKPILNSVEQAVDSSICSSTSSSKGSVGSNNSSKQWVTAVDPKTNRKYWYNRDTKVSTWRKPV